MFPQVSNGLPVAICPSRRGVGGQMWQEPMSYPQQHSGAGQWGGGTEQSQVRPLSGPNSPGLDAHALGRNGLSEAGASATRSSNTGIMQRHRGGRPGPTVLEIHTHGRQGDHVHPRLRQQGDNALKLLHAQQ